MDTSRRNYLRKRTTSRGGVRAAPLIFKTTGCLWRNHPNTGSWQCSTFTGLGIVPHCFDYFLLPPRSGRHRPARGHRIRRSQSIPEGESPRAEPAADG